MRRSTAHFVDRLLIMEKMQILCTLKDVPSFLTVYPSDILPPSVTRYATLIINTDSHTAKERTGYLCISNRDPFQTIISDSYGLTPTRLKYPDILTACVHRLGIKHDATAEIVQYSLRKILLCICALHGPRLHS